MRIHNTEGWKHRAKSRSIFRRILKPLCLLATLDAFLLVMVLQAAGVLHQLNQNSFDLFKKQVDNRQSYLQAQMTSRWMQLDDIADYVNQQAKHMIKIGRLDFDKLDNRPGECSKLLLGVVDRLISELYTKQVSGIYITFNTHDLQKGIQEGNYQPKTGIYIRDNDPLSVASEKYADLLLECAPVSVVKSMTLSTDSAWEQQFKFSSDRPYESWLVEPYTAAVETGGTLNTTDYGLWSLRHDAVGTPALTYSVPLILPDNRVYGVLGVEILPEYLAVQMPTAELDEAGVYGLMLVNEAEDGDILTGGTLCALNDKSNSFRLGSRLALTPSKFGGYAVTQAGTDYTVSLTPLSLYSRNAPFDSQHWYVMGAVPTDILFAFSSHVKAILVITVIIMLVFGIAGSLLASFHIARPITALRRELETSWDKGIPHLSKTGISEVDDFAVEITSLSRDVVNSSRRFLSIMEMSSIDMGGYELEEESGFLFVTDNFFQLFGLKDVSIQGMTPSQFRQQMERVGTLATVEPLPDGGKLYAIGNRYIHVEETTVESRHIGVAEDVTNQVVERKRIEHERDYDLLTGLYNRRAFYRNGEKLLKQSEALGVLAAVMIDLDNLKGMNDTYGHEWGDRYISSGAQCIREHVPAQSLISRVSGDEFNLLLYGFQTQEEARAAIDRLRQGFHKSVFVLPTGEVRSICASGGVCYAQGGNLDLKELIKQADFAMYLVKRGKKNDFGEFDPQTYQASETEQKKRQAFNQVLQDEQYHYVYQPIFDARTGQLYACEALLRVANSEISSTGEFLKLAQKEKAMEDVEYLTWHKSLEGFQKLIQDGRVGPKTLIFINSQVSRLLNTAEQQELIRQFGDIRDNTVMEIVETDDVSAHLSRLRDGSTLLYARAFALDDFGTGYNSDKNLVELKPKYVKLDIAMVRKVNLHPDRQLLISGLITFAHEQNMLVLAEGVETLEELDCLLRLGVDLLQGFLLARPTPVPGPIDPDALALIQSFAADTAAQAQPVSIPYTFV